MKLKTILAYGLALLSLPIALSTFIGMNLWSHKFVEVTGLQLSPRYTGGEVIRTIQRPEYEIAIHRPVFDGLFTERAEGFVQIDLKGTTQANFLPNNLTTDIDYNGDGQADFTLNYDTEKNLAQITAYNPAVLLLEGSYILKDRRAVRVKLHNTAR